MEPKSETIVVEGSYRRPRKTPVTTRVTKQYSASSPSRKVGWVGKVLTRNFALNLLSSSLSSNQVKTRMGVTSPHDTCGPTGPVNWLVKTSVPSFATLMPICASGIGAGPLKTLAPRAGSKMLL